MSKAVLWYKRVIPSTLSNQLLLNTALLFSRDYSYFVDDERND